MAFAVSYTYKVIDQASKTLAKIEKQFEQTQAAAAKVSARAASMGSNYSGFGDKATVAAQSAQIGAMKASKSIDHLSKRTEVATAGFGELAGQGLALYGLAISFASPIQAAIEFESAMADINKVMTFKEADGLKKMEGSIKRLSLEMGLTHLETAKIVEEAAKFGVAEEDLETFTKTAAKMAVAFDITAEMAGNSMAIMSNALGVSANKMEEIGNTINYVADNMATTEAKIIEAMAGGAAAGGRALGLTYEQTIALVGQFTAQGKSAAETGTRIEILAKALKNTENVSGALGASFSKLVDSNPQKAIMVLLNAINQGKIPMDKLQELIGLTALDFDLLAKNIDGYKKALELSNNKQAQAGNLQKTFETRMETTEAQLKKLGTAFHEIKINIGSAFLPIVSLAANGLSKFSGFVANATEKYPVLTTLIYSVVGAFIAIQGALLLAKVAMWAFNFAAMANPIGLLLLAATTLIITMAALSSKYKEIGSIFTEIGEPISKIVSLFSSSSENGKVFTNTIKVLAAAIRVTTVPLYAFLRVLAGIATIWETGFKMDSIKELGNIGSDIKAFATGSKLDVQAPPNAQAPATAVNENNKATVDIALTLAGNKEAVQGVKMSQVDKGNLGVNAAVY